MVTKNIKGIGILEVLISFAVITFLSFQIFDFMKLKNKDSADLESQARAILLAETITSIIATQKLSDLYILFTTYHCADPCDAVSGYDIINLDPVTSKMHFKNDKLAWFTDWEAHQDIQNIEVIIDLENDDGTKTLEFPTNFNNLRNYLINFETIITYFNKSSKGAKEIRWKSFNYAQ